MKLKIDKTTLLYIVVFTLITMLITAAANIDMIVNYTEMSSSMMLYLVFLNIIMINLLIFSIPIIKIGLMNQEQ